ncbi:hypothetical protein Bhyg_07979 [Pseudolycoriella hygida]|uniref:Uncharacterized protein n=1 Tax=Pseudolycoriella hygida TaxID=35572 RepID=A0A9Q0N3P6_9DIPT|nr:hypothetical protein Bhyg_07979 [Pseudolycoriella hygida]
MFSFEVDLEGDEEEELLDGVRWLCDVGIPGGGAGCEIVVSSKMGLVTVSGGNIIEFDSLLSITPTWALWLTLTLELFGEVFNC